MVKDALSLPAETVWSSRPYTVKAEHRVRPAFLRPQKGGRPQRSQTRSPGQLPTPSRCAKARLSPRPSGSRAPPRLRGLRPAGLHAGALKPGQGRVGGAQGWAGGGGAGPMPFTLPGTRRKQLPGAFSARVSARPLHRHSPGGSGLGE